MEKKKADNPFNLYEFIPTDEAFAKKTNCTLEEYQRFRARLIGANGGVIVAAEEAPRKKVLRAR